jgi:ATP-dependent DNA helicase DinG
MQKAKILSHKPKKRLEEVLKAHGLIAKKLENFEERAEQIEMARAVEKAIHERKHLIVEAGTGIGKSLAYLVPFIYWAAEAGKRVIVSTYTKTLQHQLTKRDLPFLREALGVDFRFTLVVGAENYLCLRRLERARVYELLDTKEEVKELEKIFQAKPYIERGLKSELDFEPSPKVWARVCREIDLCLGKGCPHQRSCYYTEARKEAYRSQVLVVNHHLFFAHLASGEKFLPPFEAVVFDEAHNLEEVAANSLGIEISHFGVRALLNSICNPRSQKGLLFRLNNLKGEERGFLEKIVDDVKIANDNFFSNLRTHFKNENIKQRIKTPQFAVNWLDLPLSNLISELSLLEDKEVNEEKKLEISAYLLRCQETKANLRKIICQEEKDYVYWAEFSATKKTVRSALHAAPVNIAPELKLRVFQTLKLAVLTSATLSTNRSFNYVRERLGLEEGEELLLDSPFDYSRQALLYLPSHMPDPWQQATLFSLRATEKIKKILAIIKGYTFVLFTSFQMLDEVHEALRKDLTRLKILRQGDMPRYLLLEEFKKSENSVLLGTSSFWQGVDVPGKALQCVIITKLPFSVPNEPVVEAKIEFLQAHNKNPFLHYQLPQAIILLKQGFGRLIRSTKDRGVVAILDPRLKSRSYGKVFLNSLPQCKITSSLSKVKEFMREASLMP